MKPAFLCLISIFLFPCSTSQGQAGVGADLPVVCKTNTAVAIATALLSEAFGAATIQDELPLIARLSNDVWKIEGTLKKGYGGGVAVIWISRIDGRVL